LVFEAEDNLGRHHVADLRLFRIKPFGYGPYGDVAIGDHARQPIVFAADGQRPDIQISHLLRRFP
jgi:hypothetical protein